MTSIEWTTDTLNPATGCTKISPGCRRCYMFRMYPRLKGMGQAAYQAKPSVVTLQPSQIDKPRHTKKPKMYFVCSMSDLFHKEIPAEYLRQVFEMMFDCPQHVFQVLTKRPQRAVQFWAAEYPDREWPEHIWMGTSVENQKYTSRLNELAKIPAPIRFVSAEPLLGPVTLKWWLERELLKWVIAGGESGPGATPMNPNWARAIRDECVAEEVPFFFKQLGGVSNKRGGDKALLDGELWHQMPVTAAVVQ